MEACELLAVEVRIDRIEAELAVELPPHMRMFAQAYAAGAAVPPAPLVMRRAEALAAARAALPHPVLADRGLALVRLIAPLAIEADAAVIAARAAPPSWGALIALAAARRAAAVAQFGHGALAVLHDLYGSPGGAADGLPGLPPPVAAWFEPDGVPLDDGAVERAWAAIRARHGVGGTVQFARSQAPPRSFVVEPGREVIVVIPAQIASPAARFAVLHELGHAVAALALAPGIPRVVDEAAAAYVARAIERPGDGWYSPAAAPARARRLLLARILDRVEHQIEAAAPPAEWPAARPPWALWHDPGAQAAYVAAEALAEAIARDLGPTPAPGALAAALDALRSPLDRAGAMPAR